MFKQLFNKFIQHLKSYTHINSEKEEIVRYGLKMIVFEIAVDAFVILMSLIFGVLPYLIVATLVFGTLRVLVGGAHLQKRSQCFVIYNIIIWSTIYLSRIITVNIVAIIIMLIINIVVFLAEAPGDTVQKPIRRKRKRKMLKIASAIAAILVYSTAIMLKNIDCVVTNILVISSVYATLLLTPLGYLLCGCKRSNKKIY